MPRYALLRLCPPDPLAVAARTPEANAYFDAMMGKPQDAIERRCYLAAAVIEASNPEDLFRKTQNIEEDWTKVHPPLKGSLKQRSTCVGDAILNLETGSVLLCMPQGWQEATPVHADILRDIAHDLLPLQG